MADDDQSYCLLCGEPVFVGGHQVGAFGQIGEIECDSCGAEYRVELSVSKPAEG